MSLTFYIKNFTSRVKNDLYRFEFLRRNHLLNAGLNFTVEPTKFISSFGTEEILFTSPNIVLNPTLDIPLRKGGRWVWTKMFCKAQRGEGYNTARQLLGHSLLHDTEIFSPVIYANTSSIICSPCAFDENLHFENGDVNGAVAYFKQFPESASQMLCAEIVTDGYDDCPGQMVVNAKNLKQVARIDAIAGGGFQPDFSYEYGGFADRMNPYHHELILRGETPNYFQLKAANASPQAVLRILKHAERNITEKQISETIDKIARFRLYEIYNIQPSIIRNRDCWRELIKVNAPKLAERIAKLDH